jgi:hypothetical protein
MASFRGKKCVVLGVPLSFWMLTENKIALATDT